MFLALGLFVIAAIIENDLLEKHPEKHLVEDFQIKLNKSETSILAKIQEISDTIVSKKIDDNFIEYFGNDSFNSLKKGTGFLIYKNNTLQFWSDRSLAFFDELGKLKTLDGLVTLPNGYYLVKSVKTDSIDIVGLHLIKYKYPYENKYLVNNYNPVYNLPKDFVIIETENDQAYPVCNVNGHFLFSILPSGQFMCTINQLFFPAIIYFIGLLVLLIYFRREFIESKAPFFLRILSLGTALFIVYWLHLVFQIPKVFFHLQFFSPDYFALNSWLPSLGDFFLMAIFFLFWMYNFGLELDLQKMHEDSKLSRKFIVTLLLLFSPSTYLLINFYVEELVLNSNFFFSFN